jgi:DNA-binding GntR family transcriptional regulator
MCATVRSNGQPFETEALRLYRALKRDILAVAFRPGQPLAETELAEKFGSSRTPIREALLRLQADDLVRIEPRRGAFVKHLTVIDFLEINELRSVLESHAARVAARRIAPETVQSLLSSLDDIRIDEPTEDDFQKLEELDSLVHNAIGEAAGNARMSRLIRGLDEMMLVMRVGDMRTRHRETHQSLRQILVALLNRDEMAAESLMRSHITDFRAAIVASHE